MEYINRKGICLFIIVFSFLFLSNNNIYSNNIINENYIDLLLSDDISYIKTSINNLVREQKIDLDNFYDNVVYVYLLAKVEEYREYSFQYVPVRLRIRLLSESKLKETKKLLNIIDLLDENKNTVSKNFISELLKKITDRLESFKPPVIVQTEPAEITKLTLEVNWFNFSRRELPVVQEKNIPDKFKNQIETIFNRSHYYEVIVAGLFQLNGVIQNFRIVDEHKNSEGKVTSKRIEMLIDYQLVQNQTQRIVYRQTGVYFEHRFFTYDYSQELGTDLNEAINEILLNASEKIFNDIDDYLDTYRQQLLSETKKVEISDEQRDILNLIFAIEDRRPEKSISGIISIENENIKVSGNVESSGEPKKSQNRFTTRENINFIYPVKNGVLRGQLRTRTTSYDKNIDLERINVEFEQNRFKVSAGNLFHYLSPLTFNNTIDGIKAEYKSPEEKNKMQVLWGRNQRAKDNRQYLRHTLGFNVANTFMNNNLISFNFIFTEDIKDSISFDTELLPEKNLLLGLHGNLNLFEHIFLDYELVHSFYEEDTRDDTDMVRDYGLNLRLMYRKSSRITYINYYKTGNEFRTLNGIATIDRRLVTLGFNDALTEKTNILLSARLQNDNIGNHKSVTNYMREYNALTNYRPFSITGGNLTKNIVIQNQVLYRQEYDSVDNSDKSKNFDNIHYNFRISNDFFNRKLNTYFLLNFIRDNDKIEEETEQTRNIELSKTYSSRFFDNLSLLTNLKFRFQKQEDRNDKYVNGNLALNYLINRLSFSFDYYYDAYYSSLENQDSLKQNFIFNMEYSSSGRLSNTYNLKIDYNTNTFDNAELDFNKITIFTGLRVMF